MVCADGGFIPPSASSRDDHRLESGISFDEIVEKYYPDITFDEIKACIQYTVELVKSEEVHIGEV